jgi:uncharacterized phage-like protein YoqJ
MVNKMILGITGHRPQTLGLDYSYESARYNKLRAIITEKFDELKPKQIVSGMALGVDTYAVQVALELGIGYIAAVPFKDQECKWPIKAQKYYCQLLRMADDVVIVSEGSYSASKMHTRNRWIVDNSDALLAIFNEQPGSGTANCVEYAKTKPSYPIHIINPINIF